jgi:hypothetical protein
MGRILIEGYIKCQGGLIMGGKIINLCEEPNENEAFAQVGEA